MAAGLKVLHLHGYCLQTFSQTIAVCASLQLSNANSTGLMEGDLVVTWTPRGNALLADRRAAPKQEV